MRTTSFALFTTVVSLTLFGLTGCQTVPYQGQARDVKRLPGKGGVVAIAQNYRPEDRTKADETMSSNCKSLPVNVLEEGEVVTGQETVSNARESNRANSEHQVGTLFGMPLTSGDKGGRDTQTSQTSKQVSEWRITYECGKPAGAPAEKRAAR